MTHPEAIAKLDLTRVQAKLAETGRSDAAIQELVSHYRSFLAQCLRPAGVVNRPSAEADLVWHQHILDTARYAQDCQRIFGRFLHHDPHAFLNEGGSAERGDGRGVAAACGDVSPAPVAA
jgi:hypothetical protein